MFKAGETKKMIKEEKISEVTIGLSSLKGKELNELVNPYVMFTSGITNIIKKVFGVPSIPVSVKGTRSDVSSLIKAIAGETKHIDSIRRYGLDNPNTYKSKYQLERAVSQFERKTGIPWPYK